VAKKILILEDEEELGVSIKKFLEQHHYQVTYLSGIARVDTIAEEAPDLILTDLLMPRVHGFDICRAVKENPQLKDIILIAMSAVYKDAFHKLEAMKIGVSDFLEKPFKFKDLLEKIEKHLGPAKPVEKPAAKEAEVSKPKIASKEPTEVSEILRVSKASGKPETVKPPKAVPHTLQEEGVTPEEESKRDQMILEQFQEMKHDYSSHLPGKIIELEDIWGRIQRGYNTEDELARFRQKVHSLTGSGTTFGFKEISHYAQQLELLVDMISMEGKKTIIQRKDKINELLDNMRHHPIVDAEMEIMRQINRG
jgi:DNA-binding response OmpR family regulator